MDPYLLLRIAHSLPAILLLLGVLAHVFMLWKPSVAAMRPFCSASCGAPA